jgi:uncharacterized protein YndB with AHSA1/START domain
MAEERYPYEIVSHWRAPGSLRQVFDVLTDAPALPRWWPSAYTHVREVAKGDPDTGVGRLSEIVTRGFLPYDVDWRLEVIETDPPQRIRVRASGDLSGVGEWLLRQDGDGVAMTYTWRVKVNKAWMQRVEFLLKPFFTINHQYVMRKGERGLREELKRRALRAA